MATISLRSDAGTKKRTSCLWITTNRDPLLQIPKTLENAFWNSICSSKKYRALLDGGLRVKVMGQFAHCSSAHYAIIQASSKKDSPERLVIAYPDEQSLRDLIAGPSIVGFGFDSREQAMANLNGDFQSPTISKQERRTKATTDREQRDGYWPEGFGLLKDRRIAQRVLQWAFSAAIVLLCSKNILSATIRMALGGSF